jgi:hypothetical protein
VGLNPTHEKRDRSMRATQQMSITLPNELAAAVRDKVASGEYASKSEVIRDGLRWQHSIPAVPTLGYSVTFLTRRT